MAVNNESGQSLIEFILMLPVMVGLTAMLVKVNEAINVAIVNQQYARAQVLYLTHLSPSYPEIRLRSGENVSQMIMGVSDNLATEGYTPEATEIRITRIGQDIGDDRDGVEPRSRGNIRIRNSVALCTQSNTPVSSDGQVAFCRSSLDEQ